MFKEIFFLVYIIILWAHGNQIEIFLLLFTFMLCLFAVADSHLISWKSHKHDENKEDEEQDYVC